MHELEQESASVAAFIQNVLDGVTPYYWEVPQSFMVPSVFFPTPEIDTAGDSLDTYEMAYTWLLKFFHKTDGEAQNLARTALIAIKNARNCIPLLNEDGTKVGKSFRLLDPSIRQVERGAWQMEVRWHSPRYFSGDKSPTVQKFKFIVNGLGDIVPSKEYMDFDAQVFTDILRQEFEHTQAGTKPELEVNGE